MLGKIITISTVVAALLVIYIMQMTNPSAAGPAGILAVFFLLYIFSLGIITGCIRVGSLVLSKIAKPVVLKRPIEPISLRHAYYHSSILAIAPIMIIGMGSVGRLGIYDILLVILFVVMGEFYIQKRIQ